MTGALRRNPQTGLLRQLDRRDHVLDGKKG